MAIDLGIGVSLERNPVSAAKEALEKAIAKKSKAKNSLALVFCTTDLSSPVILKTLALSLGERLPIIGASSPVIISPQGILKHGLLLILLGFSEDIHFEAAYAKGIGAKTPHKAGVELGEKLLSGIKDKKRNLGIIFSDRPLEQESSLINGLQERMGKSFPLVGASLADTLSLSKTHLYFKQELLTDSAIGIIFGGKINFGLGIKHGWRPLGKPRTVTRAQNNIVYEIDGKSAAKIYEEYFAKKTADLQKELKYISALYPIGIILNEGEEYLLRNILSIEDNGSLAFLGHVPEGSSIRLMIGNKESILSATKQAAIEAKNHLGGNIDFLLVLNSISRYILLRKDAHRELEIIKETIGKDIPVIGLYTHAEEAPFGAMGYYGQSYFHNQTVAVLAVGA